MHPPTLPRWPAQLAAGLGRRILRVERPPSLGYVLVGTVWTGGSATPLEGVVVVDGAGRIDAIGSDIPSPAADLPVLGGAGAWIGPGILDARVQLDALAGQLGAPDARTPHRLLTGAVLGIRDLDAPAPLARRWRTGHRRPAAGLPRIAASGPPLSERTLRSAPASARSIVQGLAAGGADVLSLRLDRPSLLDHAVVRSVVSAAHDAGLPVVAQAPGLAAVRCALEAGVDELAGVPVERLDEALVESIAASGVTVASVLQACFTEGSGRDAAANAVDLVTAGVSLRYATGIGGVAAGRPRVSAAAIRSPAPAAVRAGVDPRELDRLADSGLGRIGALRAATGAPAPAGLRGRTGLLRVGEQAALVVLPGSPLDEPGVWQAPTAVFCDGRAYR